MKIFNIFAILFFGAALGICLTLLILLSFADNGNLRKIIQDYQGLIGGVFALIGAYAAWYSLEKQNQIRREELEAARLQEAIAARASLAFLLDELSTYTLNCSTYLRARLNSAGDMRVFINLIGPFGQNYLPVPPKEVISGLFDVVKATAGSPQVALTILLQKLQINNARLVAFDERIVETGWTGLRHYEYIGHVLDVSEIQTRVAILFPFARTAVENVKNEVSADEVRVQCNQLDFGDVKSEVKFQTFFEKKLLNRYSRANPAV